MNGWKLLPRRHGCGSLRSRWTKGLPPGHTAGPRGTTAQRKLSLWLLLFGLMALSAPTPPGDAQQPLETETARLLKARRFEVGSSVEYQTSSTGTETAVPTAVTYGLTDNLELLVEPVFYTAIRPKAGRIVHGRGDLEITLTRLVLPERASFPALAMAAEVKLPTANDRLIGTGRSDYTGYLIVSKRFGKFDTHANLGYTIVGKPAGVSVKNVFNFALAEEYHLNDRFDLVGEILGTTAASREGAEGATAPELAGSEVVGMLGMRYYARPNQVLSLGVNYDNRNALLIRTGVTLGF